MTTVTAAAKQYDDTEETDDNEITIERRVKLPAGAQECASAPTMRMPKVDARLLAIARGEVEPDDPFGGLIPIYDDFTDVHDDWLVLDADPEPPSAEGMFDQVVPRLRLPPHQLLALALTERCSFFASQIDGARTFGEIIDVCRMDDLEGLETVDELLRMGAIELL